ncbi:MAG TPA: hypothetical protein VI636_25225 [Candidatus Angelobacter sp.]
MLVVREGWSPCFFPVDAALNGHAFVLALLACLPTLSTGAWGGAGGSAARAHDLISNMTGFAFLRIIGLADSQLGPAQATA